METIAALEQRARLLGISILLALAVLLIGSGFLLWGLDFVYRLQQPWLAASRETFALLFYCAIGVFKVLAVALFLIPWLALRIELRRARRAG